MTRIEEMKMLATEEAVKLKSTATPEEISFLNLETLNPNDENRCIYGQMTGDCYSDRAGQLIIECCPMVYVADKRFGGIDFEAELNGQPFYSKNRCTEFHSAIEMFILLENGGTDAQQKLIAFLKDETQTLQL